MFCIKDNKIIIWLQPTLINVNKLTIFLNIKSLREICVFFENF